MRCNVGDYALVLRTVWPGLQKFVGTVVFIERPSPGLGLPYWRVSPKTIDESDGCTGDWQDADLKPLRDPGPDAIDETIQRLGKPMDKNLRELEEALDELKRVSRELKELEKELTR